MSDDVSRKVHHVAAGEGPCLGYGGQVMHVQLSSAESGGELTVIEDVIARKNGPPLHVHSRENETYYVLEGQFEFTCGDNTVRGGPGTFVHAPRGLAHRYFNAGDTPGRVFFSLTPGGIEQFFSELTDRKDQLTPGIMTTVAVKYGITMLRPKT